MSHIHQPMCQTVSHSENANICFSHIQHTRQHCDRPDWHQCLGAIAVAVKPQGTKGGTIYIALCKPLKVNINSNTYRRETYDLTHGYLALHPIMMRIAFLSFEMSTTAPKFLMLKTPSRFLFFFLPFLDSGCLSGSRTKQRGLSDDSCQESPEAVRV